ncbi:MAG TPA: DUF998 domain-containing protein [Anaerolineales bacterium]|nr:DUF998 domain-containing protein [Anaerolineales bacterium]
MNRSRLIKLSTIAGMIGPMVFAVIVTGLTFAEAGFMRSIGWEPFGNVLDWPSGLAMGPYGWMMTINFFICGAMMAFFAYGLKLALQDKWATTFLMLGGFAMMGLIFTTDPTIRSYPKTWHGFLHDSFFAMLGIMLMLGMLLLGRVFQKNEEWKNLSIYTWGTLVLVIPTFWLKGLAFYIFLAAILIWSEVIAWRLKSITDN